MFEGNVSFRMTIFIFLFFILLLVYGYLINRYQNGWETLPEYTPSVSNGSVFISVVIAARNEENSIPRLLQSLREQDYQNDRFEVIIVDDFSTDKTLEVLVAEDKGHLNLRIITMAEHGDGINAEASSKKKALAFAIKESRGDVIVATDADCYFERSWLTTISNFFNDSDAYCVAGPVRFATEKNLLSIFQTLDFISLQGITGAALHKNYHILANGANFSYRKKVFDEVKGFDGIDSIPSGDDILLMQKIKDRYPDKIFYLKSKSAIVTTPAMNTWQAFLNQRIRWASKIGYYSDGKLVSTLIIVWLFNLSFFILAIASIINPTYAFLLILFLVAKILIDYPFVKLVSIFFGQQNLMKVFPLLQPIHILYTIMAGFFGKIGKYTWKDRKI